MDAMDEADPSRLSEENRVTFSNNSAVSCAGAIYAGGTITIANATFTGNEVTGEGAFGGAIYNERDDWDNGTLNFYGTNVFSNNTDSTGANDIYNKSTINVLGGETTIGGGITGTGTVNVQNGTLKFMADESVESFTNSNAFTIGNGTVTLLGRSGSAALGSSSSVTMDVDKLVLGKDEKDVLNDPAIGRFTGISQISGKHEITADRIEITAANGGSGIYVNDESNGNGGGIVHINGFKDDLIIKNVAVNDDPIKNNGNIGTKSLLTIRGTGRIDVTGSKRGALVSLGSAAETVIETESDITLRSSITTTNDANNNKYGSVVYANAGSISMAGKNITIEKKDTTAYETPDVIRAIGLTGTAVLTLDAKETITIAGNIDDANPGDKQNSKLVLKGGKLNVSNGTVSGFTGLFEQKGGEVALSAENGFFGGDVHVSGGNLVSSETALKGDVSVSDTGRAELSLVNNANSIRIAEEGVLLGAVAGGSATASATKIIAEKGCISIEGGDFAASDSSTGVINVESSGVLLGDAEFVKNSAVEGGGAITVSEEGSLELDGSFSFRENTSANGGAIYTNGTVSLKGNTTFEGNTCGESGGAFANNGKATIGGASFTSNIAEEKGGAIYNSGTMTFDGADKFIGNAAGGVGGAIYNAANSVINFSGENTFSGNVQGVNLTRENDAFVNGFNGGTPNDIHNEGTVNIVSGKTTLGDGFSGSGVFNNAGELVVTGGSVDSFTGTFTQTGGNTDISALDNYFGGVVSIQGGSLVADYDTMMKEDWQNVQISAEQVSNLTVTEGASLNLDLLADDDVTKRDYTIAQYNSTKKALMADDDGQLFFVNGNLVIQPGDSVILGHDDSGKIAGKIAVALQGESYLDAVALGMSIDATADKMVTIIAEKAIFPATNEKTALSVASDFTAQGLNVGSAETLTLAEGADVTFSATSDKGLFLDADGNAKALDVTVDKGASLTLGVEGQNGDRAALFGDLDNAGTFAAADTAITAATLATSGTASFVGGSVFADSLTVSEGKAELDGVSGSIGEFVASAGEAVIKGVKGALGSLAVKGADVTLADSSVTGATAVSAGKLSATAATFADLDVSGGKVTLGQLNDKGEKDDALKTTVTAGSVTISGGAMSILNADTTFEKMTATGGTFFADPSTVIIKELADNEFGTAATIGADTAVVIGGSSIKDALQHDADAEKHIEGKAALVLGKHIKLTGAGGLLVDPNAKESDVPAAGSATFAPGSMLVADGHHFDSDEEPAIITGSDAGALKVSGDATLYISNARANEVYTVAEGFSSYDVANSAWSQEAGTLILNGLVEGDIKAVTHDDRTVEIVTATAIKEDSVFFDAIPSNALHELAVIGGEVESTDMGKKFLSLAVDPTFMPDEGVAVDTINEVARAAVTAGVQNTSLRIADAASNTVVGHMSLSQHDASSAIHADGVDFWAAPMYGNLYTSGMVTSGSSVRGQFGGLALGADLEAGQFLGGKFRLGAAINGGGGQSETKGTATSTQNDYDFGGLNFYAGWNSGALNVIASVGYGFGNHEVEMGLPATMGMGSAKADIDTSAFTADLRAEYQLKTPYVDILPHAGIRYTALKTEAHDLKADGSVLNSVESDTQNIVQFPVGVTLSKDFDLSGWNVKPSVDVSFIPAAGEKKATTKVHFSDLDAWDSVSTRVMDSTSWAGTVGIQAEKGNMTFGLNYGVQASSNETDQNIQIKFGWKF